MQNIPWGTGIVEPAIRLVSLTIRLPVPVEPSDISAILLPAMSASAAMEQVTDLGGLAHEARDVRDGELLSVLQGCE
jgi:hypothetical protein